MAFVNLSKIVAKTPVFTDFYLTSFDAEHNYCGHDQTFWQVWPFKIWSVLVATSFEVDHILLGRSFLPIIRVATYPQLQNSLTFP